jgi:hypothetical protein
LGFNKKFLRKPLPTNREEIESLMTNATRVTSSWDLKFVEVIIGAAS